MGQKPSNIQKKNLKVEDTTPQKKYLRLALSMNANPRFFQRPGQAAEYRQERQDGCKDFVGHRSRHEGRSHNHMKQPDGGPAAVEESPPFEALSKAKEMSWSL